MLLRNSASNWLRRRMHHTKANRAWCKARGIRLSGPLLGRPLKATPENHQQILKNRCIARQDERDRIPIEGKFRQSKRRFSLGRVMTKLALTSQCSIALTFLVINLESEKSLLKNKSFFRKPYARSTKN